MNDEKLSKNAKNVHSDEPESDSRRFDVNEQWKQFVMYVKEEETKKEKEVFLSNLHAHAMSRYGMGEEEAVNLVSFYSVKKAVQLRKDGRIQNYVMMEKKDLEHDKKYVAYYNILNTLQCADNTDDIPDFMMNLMMCNNRSVLEALVLKFVKKNPSMADSKRILTSDFFSWILEYSDVKEFGVKDAEDIQRRISREVKKLSK